MSVQPIWRDDTNRRSAPNTGNPAVKAIDFLEHSHPYQLTIRHIETSENGKAFQAVIVNSADNKIVIWEGQVRKGTDARTYNARAREGEKKMDELR